MATCGRLASEHGADALILACGGMADVARAVEQRVGVPVCDGVAFGAGLAHALWSCGLRTSKAGAYAAPEPIPYTGHAGLTVHAATFREYGGPEVMRWEQLDDPACDRDEVIMRVQACGLNHSDLDSRAGTSRWPFTMPWVLGAEFAGTVEAVGDRRRRRRRGRPGHRLPAVRLRQPAGPAAAGGPTCASGSWCSAPTAGAATASWCQCRRGR